MTAALPTISVAFDHADEAHVIYATSYGRTAPAGERLFRAPPHPAITFRHEEQASAEKDAATLREYISRTWQGGPSKAKVRKQGAD